MIEILDQTFVNLNNILDPYLQSRPLSNNKFTWSSIEILKQVKESSSDLKVLCVDKKIVSLVIYNNLSSSIEILYLESHPSHLRKGYMNQLLKFLIKEWSQHPFWLDVHEENEAGKKLYLSFGFKQTGRRKDYYKDGGACLQLTLDPRKSINS